MSPETFAFFAVLAGCFGLFITVLWILLPFAVFGIKPILTDIRDELRKGNER